MCRAGGWFVYTGMRQIIRNFKIRVPTSGL